MLIINFTQIKLLKSLSESILTEVSWRNTKNPRNRLNDTNARQPLSTKYFPKRLIQNASLGPKLVTGEVRPIHITVRMKVLPALRY